jgi:predicted ester cyclase
MSSIENKKVVVRMIEDIVAAGKLDFADHFVATDFQLHLPGVAEPMRGIESLKDEIKSFRAGFPDRKIRIEDIIAEGDKVVVRVIQECTHQGVFQGVNPTGKKVKFTNVVIFRVAHGKIAEEWLSSDRLSLLQQIGALPLTHRGDDAGRRELADGRHG